MPPNGQSVANKSNAQFIGDHASYILKLDKLRPDRKLFLSDIVRLNTYKTWPYFAKAWPTKLSKAGFFYDPESDKTICFVCNLKISGSSWQNYMKPEDFHKTHKPDCPYMKGILAGVVPLQTSEQRKKRLSYLSNPSHSQPEPESENSDGMASTSNSSLQVSENRVSQSLIEGNSPYAPVEHQSLQSLSLNVNNINNCPIGTGTQNSSMFNAPSSLPHTSPLFPNQTVVNREAPNPLSGMEIESHRLDTYTDWPNRQAISPEELAQAGFFFTGSADRVQCAFCENVLRNWELGDDALAEHMRHFPRCRFMTNPNDCGNVPLLGSQRRSFSTSVSSSNQLTTFNGRGGLRGQRVCPEQNELLPRSQPTGQGVLQHRTPGTVPPVVPNLFNQNGSANSGDLGINMLRPKHPEYAIESKRMSTYADWDDTLMQQPGALLCRAGFYFTGLDDNVRCFFCDGGLRNWEDEDDPFQEHARWFPRCYYIRQMKGDDYVNAISSKYPRQPNMPSMPAQEPSFRTASLPAGVANPTFSGASSGYHSRRPSGGSSGTRSFRNNGPLTRNEEQAIRGRMKTPAVRAIIDMGFEPKVVLKCIRQHYKRSGGKFPSAETLLEAIFTCDRPIADEPEEGYESGGSSMQGDENPPARESTSRSISPSQVVPKKPLASPSNSEATISGNETTNRSCSPPDRLTSSSSNISGNGTTDRSSSSEETASSKPPSSKKKKKKKNNKNGNSGNVNGESNSTTLTSPQSSSTQGPSAAVTSTECMKKNEEQASGSTCTIKDSTKTRPHNTERNTLLEENRTLKDQRTCKVCMDGEVNIVFLPCGHLVCCVNCAPALRNCAVCRSLIRGTVRTYLS